MIELVKSGGPMFTLPLVALFLAIVGLIALSWIRPVPRRISLVVHLGIFAAVFGLLGQTLGLIQALDAIEMMGGVSPAMLAGGLKVSFITTIFGLVDLSVAVAGWTVLKYRGA